MALIQSTAIPSGAAAHEIEDSVLLVGAHCEGEITQTGGDRKTHTISFWHKRAPIGIGTGAGEMESTTNDIWGTPSEGDTLRFNGSSLAFFQEGGSGGQIYTTARFRDCSAWYHFVIAVDTTLGTAANRLKMYVNGVLMTEFDTEDYPDQNAEFKLMQNGQVFRIGAGHGGTTTADGQGYNAEFIIVDGAAKAASDFGEFNGNGIWVPKKYTGDFNTGSGTNGAHYKFEGTAEGTGAGSTGLDSSGNSNNMNFENQVGGLTDTPTNNFCTLNPLDRTISTTYDGQLVRGMLEYQPESGYSMVRGTMGMTSGKWYWEIKVGSNAGHNFGVCTANMNIPLATTQENGFVINSIEGDAEMFAIYAASHYRSYHVYDGTNWNSAAAWSDVTNISSGDILGFAFDADNLDIYFSKSGSWTNVLTNQDPEGDPGSNTPFVYHAAINNDENEAWLPFVSNNYNQDMHLNFGNPVHSISSGNADANGYGNFEYAVPDGYYALCTKNLAEFG